MTGLILTNLRHAKQELDALVEQQNGLSADLAALQVQHDMLADRIRSANARYEMERDRVVRDLLV